jgi:hypothetical protein
MLTKISVANNKIVIAFGCITLFFIGTDILNIVYNLGTKAGSIIRGLL